MKTPSRTASSPSTRAARGGSCAARSPPARRAIGAVDADVHVQPEGVVAPDDVAEELVVAAVVRRVDDALLLPRAPRMRAGGRESDAERLASARAAGRGARRSSRPPLRTCRTVPVRTSTSEAISSPTRCGSRSVPFAAACTSSKRLTRPSVDGSSSSNSSSTATVKSGTVSNEARDVASSSSYPTFCSSPTTKRVVARFSSRATTRPAPVPLHGAPGGERRAPGAPRPAGRRARAAARGARPRRRSGRR